MKLIETIRFENGRFYNVDLHQKRMNYSRKRLFDSETEIDLYNYLNSQKPLLNRINLQKCKITYDNIIHSIEVIPYKIKTINSLKLVECNHIEYNYKFENRTEINKLCQKRDKCDDILILKNGLVTDTSYCNIIFYNGKNWITPEKPLLKGIQRQFLIDNELVETANIHYSDIYKFQKLKLINAMMDFKNSIELSPSKILY